MARDLIPRLVLHPGGDSQLWVCWAPAGIRGVASGRPRSARLAWDVEELLVAEGSGNAGVELLDHLAGEAAKQGARRVFLTTPPDTELARIARQAGFVNYTSETLYNAQLPEPVPVSEAVSARPRLRQDAQPLFQLYNAAVPCRVRMAEAMTIDAWAALHRGGRLWSPALGGNHKHFVWDAPDGLAAWLQLSFGARSRHVELLIHPNHRESTEEMVLHSLSRASYRAPVYATVREYQPDLAGVLERQGFSRSAEYLVYARELAARVPGRALVPARA